VIDLVESHVDLAVRIGRLPDSDLVARPVGQVRWLYCASPDYLARRGEPATPAALAEHDCIAFEGLQTHRGWLVGSGPTARSIAIHPRFSVNTADAIIEAAAAGLGIARIMSYQAAGAISDGRLRLLLKGVASDPIPVNLVHRRQRIPPLKRRAFMDYVVPRLHRALETVAEVVNSA
jgi:DNA-binding transcriptional LysR family regulator